MTWEYDPASGLYTSTIPPGSAAFRDFLRERFGYTRVEIVRDRSRCQHQRSEHCECRGVDAYTRDLKRGRVLFDFVVANHDLGFQSCIFARRVIGFGNPNERDYDGEHDHFDHVHTGLTKHAARTLTRAQLDARLDGQKGFPMGLTDQQQKDLAANAKSARDAAHKAKNLAATAVAALEEIKATLKRIEGQK